MSGVAFTEFFSPSVVDHCVVAHLEWRIVSCHRALVHGAMRLHHVMTRCLELYATLSIVS